MFGSCKCRSLEFEFRVCVIRGTPRSEGKLQWLSFLPSPPQYNSISVRIIWFIVQCDVNEATATAAHLLIIYHCCISISLKVHIHNIWQIFVHYYFYYKVKCLRCTKSSKYKQNCTGLSNIVCRRVADKNSKNDGEVVPTPPLCQNLSSENWKSCVQYIKYCTFDRIKRSNLQSKRAWRSIL